MLKSIETEERNNMKRNRIAAILAASALAMSMAACSAAKKAEEAANTDTNKAAIVGSWQLSKVLVSETEGENPIEVQEADHASLFGEKENVYTFNEDGTGRMTLDKAGFEDKIKEFIDIAIEEIIKQYKLNFGMSEEDIDKICTTTAY